MSTTIGSQVDICNTLDIVRPDCNQLVKSVAAMRDTWIIQLLDGVAR